MHANEYSKQKFCFLLQILKQNITDQKETSCIPDTLLKTGLLPTL